MVTRSRRRSAPATDSAAEFPRWVQPQLTKLVEAAPEGDQWAHEIKLDGYRMHARIDGTEVRILTRTGLRLDRKIPDHRRGLEATAAQASLLGRRTVRGCGKRRDKKKPPPKRGSVESTAEPNPPSAIPRRGCWNPEVGGLERWCRQRTPPISASGLSPGTRPSFPPPS
jgi:hypothetical protein